MISSNGAVVSAYSATNPLEQAVSRVSDGPVRLKKCESRLDSMA